MFLAGVCPHQLFANTKRDLGACHLVHDAKLRLQCEQRDGLAKHPEYERATAVVCERVLRDMERLKAMNEDKVRAELGARGGGGGNANETAVGGEAAAAAGKAGEDEAATVELSAVDEARINALDKRITELQAEMERLGEEGEVDESLALMPELEKVTEERDLVATGKHLSQAQIARGALTHGLVRSSGGQSKAVCTVCGGVISGGERDERLDAHVQGKVHQGMMAVRKFLDDLHNKPPVDWSKVRKSPERSRSAAAERREHDAPRGPVSKKLAGVPYTRHTEPLVDGLRRDPVLYVDYHPDRAQGRRR